MGSWTLKHWGALIGAALVLLVIWVGLSDTVLIVAGAVIGYFVGRFLEGESSLGEFQQRQRERQRGRRAA